MPVATLQPPANPVVIYSTENSDGTWTCTKSSGGTALATSTSTPVSTCAAALNTAGVDHSTLVTLLSPSSNPRWNGQLADMLNISGA